MHQQYLTLYQRLCLAFVFILCSRGDVYSQANADFVMDKPGGCSPVAVTFTNKTTGASTNAVYNWDFGNGNNSSLINGGAIYTLAKTYTVTLTVTDGSQTSSKTSFVNVYQNPTVDFSPSIVSGCVPLSVTFTSNSNPGDGSLNSYTWDFGDGNTQTNSGIAQSHIYSVVQNPIVSLTVTNSFGCHTTLQKNNLLNVVPGVSASFTADKNYLCQINDPVQFTNTSTGPGTLSYNWDFGDGNNSTQKDPQYSFNKKGIYTVKLQVSSSAGCVATSTLSNTLNVASYNSDFSIPAILCNSAALTFTNMSSPVPDNDTWNVDGIPAGSTKDLGYTFNISGVHSISLTNTFGTCPQNITKNIVVNDLPGPAGISYTEQGKCGPPEAVIFKDLSNATKHEWDFNYNYYSPNITSTDPQPSYFYPSEYVYNVWLRSTNDAGCSITTTQQLLLFDPKVWIYSDGNESTCGTPNTQNFTCSRTDLTSYLWHFGDGTTSTEVSPTHAFTGVGAYSTYLTYTDPNGCSGSTNYLQFYVSPPLQIDFTASSTSVCGNTFVSFAPTSNDPNNILYDSWNFGDGNTDYYSGHTYDKPGTYSITLTLTSPGCTATLTKTDYITVAPLFFNSTGFTNTCDGDRGTVDFTENVSGADRLIWNFGDGTTDTTAGNLTDLKHNYIADGSYNMTVTAVNDLYGCTIDRDFPISVLHKQNPLLTADKTVVCTGDVLNIKIDDVGLVTGTVYLFSYFSLKFEYGDGTAYSGIVQPPYFDSYYGNEFNGSLSSFEKGKTNLRVITTSSNFNCNDTSNFIPLEIKGAKAGFEIVQDHQCFQTPVILKDTSSVDPGNSILSWLWDFGDGSTLTSSGTVTHVYTQPGSYPIKLTVQDASGCSTTSASDITTNVSVNGPEAIFTSSGNNVALNTTVYFYNGTNSFGSLNTIYSWKFSDDGSISTDYNPSHTYNIAGTFTVTLTSSDPVTGCSSTTSQTIQVSSFNSSFTHTNSYVSGSCPPVLVNFTNTSVNFTKVTWDFGDGVTADSLNNVSHVYKDPGKYIITLTVFGQNGLEEQYIDSVIIKAPVTSMAVNPMNACIGSIITDTAMSTNANNYIWDFGDGSISNSSVPKTTHQYLSSGIYNPKLIIQDVNGCAAGSDLIGQVNIHPNPIATIIPANAMLCQGSNLTIVADGGLTYKWSPAAGLSNDATATPVASPSVTTTYHLNIADDLGCQSTASTTITVINPGKLQAGNDTTVCDGSAVQLNASGETIYNWIDNTDGLNNTNISNPIAKPITTTSYTVAGTDANNCFNDTAYVTIRVLPLPTVNAGQDTTVQAGSSFTLHGSGSSDIVQWNWTPAKFLSCSDCPTPLCTTNETINYTLSAKTQDGCSSSAHVVIKLECDEARISIPNAFTPNGDGLNDLFVIKGISLIRHMVIYDRWGEKVFERNNFNPSDPSACWNGYFNGMEAATGGYVYFVEMQCPMGGAFSRKGTVLLIR
jgi:gliding motility-associated-like protein